MTILQKIEVMKKNIIQNGYDSQLLKLCHYRIGEYFYDIKGISTDCTIMN